MCSSFARLHSLAMSDPNGDGYIDLQDAILISKYLSEKLFVLYPEHLDYNCNGIVSQEDVMDLSNDIL